MTLVKRDKKGNLKTQKGQDGKEYLIPETKGKCKICGLEFTQKDYDNASKGVCGDDCLVGDYDDICYPCQFKYGVEKWKRQSW